MLLPFESQNQPRPRAIPLSPVYLHLKFPSHAERNPYVVSVAVQAQQVDLVVAADGRTQLRGVGRTVVAALVAPCRCHTGGIYRLLNLACPRNE